MHFRSYRKLLYKAIKWARRAEAANRIKTDFVANLSYELRTPLTTVIGMAQLLSIDCLLPNQQERVTDILMASEHMLALVDKLSDSIRLEIGEVAAKAELFDLRSLFDEVIQMLNFHVEAKGLQLLFNYSADVPTMVIGDIHLVRQLVLNLLSNTLRLTEQGLVIIRVACEKRVDQLVELMFSIKDTGKGMTVVELDKVRTCLHQVEVSRDHHYGGIDLGLAIMATYLKLLHAKLDIQSEIGLGTVAICRIPFELPITPMLSLEKQVIESDLDDLNRLYGLRILFVEDNPLARKVYSMMLTKMGCSVDVATEASSALQLYKKHLYDIIFMDIGLPGLDGIEITKLIRQLELQRKRTPIIALTAHAQEEDKNRFLAAQIDGVMTKPVQLRDFSCLLEKWVLDNTESLH